MRKRKLITRATLELINSDLQRGVPLARAMRNNNITMSRPAVAKLVGHFQALLAGHANLESSLFPDWLVVDEQEQPDSIIYEGYFPHGDWTQ